MRFFQTPCSQNDDLPPYGEMKARYTGDKKTGKTPHAGEIIPGFSPRPAERRTRTMH